MIKVIDKSNVQYIESNFINDNKINDLSCNEIATTEEIKEDKKGDVESMNNLELINNLVNDYNKGIKTWVDHTTKLNFDGDFKSFINYLNNEYELYHINDNNTITIEPCSENGYYIACKLIENDNIFKLIDCNNSIISTLSIEEYFDGKEFTINDNLCTNEYVYIYTNEFTDKKIHQLKDFTTYAAIEGEPKRGELKKFKNNKDGQLYNVTFNTLCKYKKFTLEQYNTILRLEKAKEEQEKRFFNINHKDIYNKLCEKIEKVYNNDYTIKDVTMESIASVGQLIPSLNKNFKDEYINKDINANIDSIVESFKDNIKDHINNNIKMDVQLLAAKKEMIKDDPINYNIFKGLKFEYDVECNALDGNVYLASSALYNDILINRYIKDMDNATFIIYTFENEKGYLKRNTKEYKNLKNEIEQLYSNCIINDYTLKGIRGIEVIKIKENKKEVEKMDNLNLITNLVKDYNVGIKSWVDYATKYKFEGNFEEFINYLNNDYELYYINDDNSITKDPKDDNGFYVAFKLVENDDNFKLVSSDNNIISILSIEEYFEGKEFTINLDIVESFEVDNIKMDIQLLASKKEIIKETSEYIIFKKDNLYILRYFDECKNNPKYNKDKTIIQSRVTKNYDSIKHLIENDNISMSIQLLAKEGKKTTLRPIYNKDIPSHKEYILEQLELYNSNKLKFDKKRINDKMIEEYTKYFIYDNNTFMSVKPSNNSYPSSYYDHVKKYNYKVDTINKIILFTENDV